MNLRVPTIALAGLLILTAARPTAAVVENPAEPPGGVETVSPTEAWRAGGEDDEVFFGSVGRVLAGPDGQVMVLDTQLAEVQVYDRDGQWLKTLGREGEGPGEVRDPADCLLTPDGRLCLLQSFPGRLVFLNQDGTPAGQAQYQPLGEPATFSVMVSGRRAPDGLLLAGIRFKQTGPQAMQTFFLSRCDADGAEEVVYLEKQYAVNYADFHLDEGAMDFVWVSRMAIDDAGRVYTAPDRNGYLVRVQDPDGSLHLEFARDATLAPRTEEEREIAVKIHEAIGANYGGIPLRGVTVEDTDPMIANLWVRPDGEVWIQTPANEAPEGSFSLIDVFDAEGRFQRQVALELPGDPRRDGLFLLRDGRVVLVMGGLDAWLSQQGVAASDADAPVLEIVVYDAI